MKSLCIFLLTFLQALLFPVVAAEEGTAPTLRVETGMHTSVIWKLDVDAANRLAATVATDCSVRIWDLHSGKLLRTLLMPRGESLNSVAISPDGRTVVCGGWTYDGALYIFDVADGHLQKRLTGLPSTSAHLAFNRSGTLLAVTIYGNGVRVYRTSDFSVAFENKESGSTSFGADFDANDRLITCGGTVRLYDRAFQLKATWRDADGHSPYAIRFSPDGSEIAVAMIGADHVQVLSGANLAPLRSFPFPTSALAGIGWTPDGAFLYAGSAGLIRRWAHDGTAVDFVQQRQVTCLQPLVDGSVAYATASPSWGKAASSSNPNFEIRSQTANMSAHLPRLAVSADASVVQFSYALGESKIYHFDLRGRQIHTYDTPAAAPALVPPRTSAPGMVVTDYETGANQPVLNGKLLKGPAGTSSMAFAPDGQTFAVSGGWAISCFDIHGGTAWDLGRAYGSRVNFSNDGGLFIVAYTDGTIRWYRVSDRRELLAFFPHSDRQRWVLWTPEGYYDCSPGAEDLIAWQIHHGRDREPGFYSAAQFRNVYYRPDVIKRVLDVRDVPTALREADRERHLPETDPAQIGTVIATLSPPVVHLETGGVFATQTLTPAATQVTIRYHLEQMGDEAATTFTARFNGRPLAWNGPVPKVGETAEVTVPIPAKEAGELTLFASHRLAVSEAAVLHIVRDPPPPALRKPNLYAVAAGVAHLKVNTRGDGAASSGGDLVLDDIPLADRDARQAAAALSAQKGRLYGETHVQLLLNEQATAAGLRDALTKLAAQATPDDVALVFFSGHGVADPKVGFYLATYEADPNSPEATALSGHDLSAHLERIKARTVLALDTCHSGGALGGARLEKVITSPSDLMGLMNELSSAEQGTVVLSSSAASEQSLGDPKKGGIFTQAFCEALTTRAAASDGSYLTCRGMQAWLNDRVPKLAAALVKGVPNAPNQTPCLVIPKGVPDFPLAKPFAGSDPPSRFRVLNIREKTYWLWTRIVDHWEMNFPSGRVRQFQTSGRDTVEGRAGTILQSAEETDLQMFVSDKSAAKPRIYLRKATPKWGFFGDMTNLE